MTIDEMLAKVAENVGAKPPVKQTPPKQAPPKQADKGCCGGGEHKCHCKDAEKLTLEAAKFIASGVEIAARNMGVNVVIAIDNEGANLVLLHAMDDSYIASIKASQDKAYTAVALKMPTEAALKEARGGSLDGLTNGNGLLLLGGGCPIESNGKILGGIGVSGGTKEQDILLAQIGARLFLEF